MILEETTTVLDAELPLARFRDHLRLGSGFGDETVQDDLLAGFLRAALAAIEGRLGKALLVRGFSWQVFAWREPRPGADAAPGQVLPIAPVRALTDAVRIAADGTQTPLDLAVFRLLPDPHRPRLCPAGSALPTIPSGGSLRLGLQAGLSDRFELLPADLAQAVLMLATHYHDYRHEVALGPGCMPFGVTSLIQRYRPLRLGAA